MPPLAEHGIRQKLKVTRLVYGLLGWEERPPPPLSSHSSRQLLNDEERHQGQNNRIEAIVPVSIAFAGAAAAPAAVSESGGIHSLAILCTVIATKWTNLMGRKKALEVGLSLLECLFFLVYEMPSYMTGVANIGTSTAPSFLAHEHHYLLKTNVKQESEQETLYRAPKPAAVPLATAAAIVVVSASRIHSLVAFYSSKLY